MPLRCLKIRSWVPWVFLQVWKKGSLQEIAGHPLRDKTWTSLSGHRASPSEYSTGRINQKVSHHSRACEIHSLSNLMAAPQLKVCGGGGLSLVGVFRPCSVPDLEVCQTSTYKPPARRAFPRHWTPPGVEPRRAPNKPRCRFQ